MKWKKKGGAFRCGEGRAEIRIEEIEGQFWLSWRLPSGAWEQGQPFPTIGDAKMVGEKVLSAIVELADKEKQYLKERRDYYQERQRQLDAEPPENKAIKRAFQMYMRLSGVERAYVRMMKPDITKIFDEVLQEVQPEQEAADA